MAAHKPAYMCLYPPPVKDPDVDRADTVTFRVMTYNALNFSWNDGNRADYFETIFDSTNVDVILMQEMVDEAGCDTLLNRLNSDSTEFARAQFINGYGTDNILFYRTSKCSLLSQDTIQTDLRDIFAVYRCHPWLLPGWWSGTGYDLRFKDSRRGCSPGPTRDKHRLYAWCRRYSETASICPPG